MTDATAHERLMRNPNPTKTKLTRQPMGKNGPLRYIRWAASFAGIGEDELHNYGTNSWRKVGANKLAQQAGAKVMEIVRQGTFHKSDSATKAYLNAESMTAIATASAQVLADASRVKPNEVVGIASQPPPADHHQHAPPQLPAMLSQFSSGRLIEVSGNNNTTININLTFASEPSTSYTSNSQ